MKRPIRLSVANVYPAPSAPSFASPAPASSSDWLHLKPYGYAPGGYIGDCRHCRTQQMNLDKRATSCRPCAQAAFDAQASIASGMPPVDRPKIASVEAAILEAHELGLRVTFGKTEVSESGGFGIPLSVHGGDVCAAFIDLVETVGVTDGGR